MKRGLLSLIALFLLVGVSSAQITSVGIIGTATPDGWDSDTNMVQDPDSSHLWTLTVTLTEGLAKFRADDDWTVNWGEEKFPLGTGTQDGDNVPIPFYGTYDVSFNSNTGEYYFSAVSSVGIIGSSTPFEWNEDINMSPDTSNPNMFWTELDLTAGAAKFRLNDDWAVNWGSTDFPTGIGTQDGSDIPIPKAGNYTISIDTSSGEYNFKENVDFLSIGLFGDATPGGWDSETFLAQTNGDDAKEWSGNVRLTDGGLQFSGDSMNIVWGASDFPEGTATVAGDTLQVSAGLYKVTFHTKTLAYKFEEVKIYETIGIIGDATPGGWAEDTDMERSATDSSEWSLRIELLDGFAKFRADNDWAESWGSGEWPQGTANTGADIPVTAGLYNVTFNTFTLAFRFQELLVYDTVGIIGTGTPFGDWDNDVYMDKDPADENMWTISEVALTDGEVKFRANSNWDVNWGDSAWPSGVGVQEGDNILSVAGNWGVMLNSITGEYAFGDPLTGTEELLNPSDVKVFPNPVTDMVNIDLSGVDIQGELTINVYNMNGQLVQTQNKLADQLVQISVATLPTGHYMMQIRNEDYIVGKRIVIAN